MDKRPKNFPKSGSTLTPDRVRVIRRGCEKGLPAIYFAKLYGVNAETIRKVARYESWGWVSDEEGISMTPSENVRDWPQQVEDEVLARVPERSPEEIAKSYAEVQERLKKAPNPYAGFDGLSEKTLRGYIGIMRFKDGRLTQEHVDEILAYRQSNAKS